MYTQCPECNTVFRISPEQLAAAGGRVRCGECHSVFNAQHHLMERVQHLGAEPQTESRGQASESGFDLARETPAAAQNEPLDALFATEPAPAAPEADATDLDAFLEPGAEADIGAPHSYDVMASELDALLESSADADTASPAVEPSDALFSTEQAVTDPADLEAFLDAEPETTEQQAGPADVMASELDALLDTTEQAERTAAEVAPGEAAGSAEPAVSGSDSAYEVDLNAFFAAEQDESEQNTMPQATAVELDELFSSDAAPESAAVSAPSPAPSAGGELFGEEQIESLLHPQDAENLELPWDRAEEQDQPAVVVDLSDESARMQDEFADLNLDSRATGVDEFDLPEPQLSSAQSAGGEKQAFSNPLPDLLAQESVEPARSNLAGLLGWSLGIVLLLALLVAQYGYLNRDLLVLRYPQLRPTLELACAYTGCRLPPQRDLSAITLLERDIRTHDTYQGALVITATLLNRADFAQPYPDVEVIMRDLGGNIVAARRFLPSQYLSGAHPAQFASQASAQLQLEVSDPGAAAVGFEFNFY